MNQVEKEVKELLDKSSNKLIELRAIQNQLENSIIGADA